MFINEHVAVVLIIFFSFAFLCAHNNFSKLYTWGVWVLYKDSLGILLFEFVAFSLINIASVHDIAAIANPPLLYFTRESVIISCNTSGLFPSWIIIVSFPSK